MTRTVDLTFQLDDQPNINVILTELIKIINNSVPELETIRLEFDQIDSSRKISLRLGNCSEEQERELRDNIDAIDCRIECKQCNSDHLTLFLPNPESGDLLPDIDYSENERMTWSAVYKAMKQLHAKWASRIYLDGLGKLEKECGYSPDNVPQFKTISTYLQRTTGFRLRPAYGLVSPRDFLSHLAFRVFPATQFIRHHDRPLHTPEPDCIHELLGHMPLLTNRSMADFTQQIGLLSLGKPDELIQQLATLYWFTIEFGLIGETKRAESEETKEDNNDDVKAYGAGIMSSPSELENAMSPDVKRHPFDPVKTVRQDYDDVTYQTDYFVIDSVSNMQQKLINYFEQVSKSPTVRYDPVTETMRLVRDYYSNDTGKLLGKVGVAIQQLESAMYEDNAYQ